HVQHVLRLLCGTRQPDAIRRIKAHGDDGQQDVKVFKDQIGIHVQLAFCALRMPFSSCASCSGSTVRGSNSTRSSSTRAIIGGQLRRSRAANWFGASTRYASKKVGRLSSGSEPPPT